MTARTESLTYKRELSTRPREVISPPRTTGGGTFGTVYAAYGTASAAFGTLVSAMNETKFEDAKCPCLVVSISRDEGKNWSRNLVAPSGQWDPTGTVRYPIAAANPAKAGSYAVGVYAPDHKSVQVYYTADYGKSWKMATPKPIPPTVSFITVNQVDTGYTSDGKILVTWRAWRNVAAHNTFVAMLDGDAFGPTVKVTPELSIDPAHDLRGVVQRRLHQLGDRQRYGRICGIRLRTQRAKRRYLAGPCAAELAEMNSAL